MSKESNFRDVRDAAYRTVHKHPENIELIARAYRAALRALKMSESTIESCIRDLHARHKLALKKKALEKPSEN